MYSKLKAILKELYRRLKGEDKYILFINDTEDDYHYGCTATSRTIKDHIRKDRPGLKLVSINVREVWKAQCQPLKEHFFLKDQFEWYEEANPRLVELVRKASAVVVNGEGTIVGYDGRAGTQNLLYLIKIAEDFGKSVSLINHSAFPSDDPQVLEIYREVYSKLTFCAVRDRVSLEKLKALGCHNVRLAFDSSPDYIARLFHETEIPYERDEYICLSGGRDVFRVIPEFLKQCAPRLADAFGKRLVFLMSDTAVKAEDDLRCIEAINEFNKHSGVQVEVYWAHNVDEFLTFIKHAFCTITGRFHHSVMATALKKPFVVYSTNTPKNEVFATLGAGVFANLSALKEEDVAEHVRDALERASKEGEAASARALNLALENYREWPLCMPE